MRGIYLPIEQVLQGFPPSGKTADHASGSQTHPHRAGRSSPAQRRNSSPAAPAYQARDRSHPLPEGYHLEWGGEYESSRNAQGAVFGSLPLGYLVMFMITILLFDSFKRPP